MSKRIDRRHFLVTSGGLAALAMQMACNQQALEVPTPKPSGGAAAPPTAPAPAAAAPPAPAGHPPPPPAVDIKFGQIVELPRNETLVISVSDTINQMTDSAIFNQH